MTTWDSGTSGTSVWNYWQTQTSGTTVTDIWNTWVNAYTTATTTCTVTANDVWQVWVNQYPAYQPAQYQPPTEEELAVIKERQEAVRKASEERAAKAAEEQKRMAAEFKVARERAAQLLRENLSQEQVKQLEQENGFDVVSQSGKNYRIEYGSAGNVYSLDEKRKKLARFCIHAVEQVPNEDHMIAQYLWLKWCEEDFLKTANKTLMAA